MQDKSSQSDRERLQRLLRDSREAAGLRQADVAERLGQPQSYVSKYESGERRLDVLELRAVLRVFGLSVAEFMQKFEDVDGG